MGIAIGIPEVAVRFEFASRGPIRVVASFAYSQFRPSEHVVIRAPQKVVIFSPYKCPHEVHVKLFFRA